MSVAWINGDFVDTAAVNASAYDPGLLIGEGLFETLAAYNGRVFALREHLSRLESSSEALGLESLDFSAIHLAVQQGAERLSGSPVARIRVTVWRSALSSTLQTSSTQVACSVLAEPFVAPHLGTVNDTPARLVTSQYVRNERSALTGHKSTAYFENTLALRSALSQGGTEALLLNTRGEVSEGSTSNILFEIGGELITPPLSSGCLPGVTRHISLALAQENNIPMREAHGDELTIASTQAASAALLGTFRNVQQVSQWDGRPMTEGRLITALMDVFATHQHKFLD
ncbi:aminotransferase class IV [Timonella sp. A28]|uniref:aminotransferase class IV n=1 Tax=Timonella sp. A28 TaxID=3442640 RepID=UPI003EBEDC20